MSTPQNQTDEVLVLDDELNTESSPPAPLHDAEHVSPNGTPSSTSNVAGIAAAGYVVVTLVAVLVLRTAQNKAVEVVAELGEAMAMAGDWIGWVFLFGYGWIVYLAFTAFSSGRHASQLTTQVGLLARHGLSIDAAIRRADTTKAELVVACRSGAARAANFQVLLGMLMTASWLALKAKVFVDAGGMLSSASGGMGRIVSDLLQLGPEAFVTTSTALVTAVILSAEGMALVAIVRRLLPKDEHLVAEWKQAHDTWLDSEKGAQTTRTEELVAQAVSTKQVEALQQSFKFSMQSVGELLGEVRNSLATLQSTASLMGSSYEKLGKVTDALAAAQFNVSGVAESIKELTAQVKGYGTTLLEGTENFTERLVQDTSTRIPEVVSRATLETVESMKPHLRSLTNQMHGDLTKSAEAIQLRYSRAFDDNLQKADSGLMRVNQMSVELEVRASRLAQTVGETAGSWQRSMESVAALHQRLDEVAERSRVQAEQSLHAQSAISEASRDTAQMIRELSRLVGEARGEVSAIRRDAELLGQIREAVHQGGQP